jgi:hypothetical protein
MLRPSYIAELDSDFAKIEMKDFMLEMKNNQATGYDGMPVELRKKFYIRKDAIGTLTYMFNKIKNGKEFPLDCKTAIMYPVHREKPRNYRGISLYRYVAEFFRESWMAVYHMARSVLKAGLIKGKQTTDYVFVIKTTIDKYFRFKLGCLYWCFVASGKVFVSVHRGALWYKLRRKAISDNMAKCVKEMYDGIKFCLKCGEDEVTDFI